MYSTSRTSEDYESACICVDLEEFKSQAGHDPVGYDEDNPEYYYQLGIQYCTKPASKSVNTLSVFVPGKYFSVRRARRTSA